MFRSTALVHPPKAFHLRPTQIFSCHHQHRVIAQNRLARRSTIASSVSSEEATSCTHLPLVKIQTVSQSHRPALRESPLRATTMRKRSFTTDSNKSPASSAVANEPAAATSSASSSPSAPASRPLWFKVLQRFEGIPYPPLGAKWWLDKIIVFFVFAVTGSSTLFFVRPLLSNVLHITGTMIDGPWSYRLAAIFLITPAYTALLLTFGSLAGRREFFMKLARKMWGRFIPGLKDTKQQKEQNKTDVQKRD